MTKQTKLVVALSATALLALGLSAVSFAAGWDNSTGEWQYIDSNGDAVTDKWVKNGDYWFYLGDDGNMVRDQIVEDNSSSTTKYYYVDENGAMITNAWKALPVDDNEDLDAECYWYYFGSDGKAYTTDSDKDLTSSRIKEIKGLKYAFDEYGHMLYGWIDKTGKEQQDSSDTAWADSEYYFNGWNDGHMATGWQQLTVEDDNDSETYWFYFGSDGKKTTDGRKKINGVYYHFDKADGHMLDEWVSTASDGSVKNAATNSIAYVNGDGSERKKTWVWAIPDSDWNKSDNEDDEYSWFWFNSSGKMVDSKVEKINGKWYAFDNYGRMLTKFVSADSDNAVTDTKVFDTDEDTRASVIEANVNDDLYFFSDDEEKDGSRKTGYQTIELSDGSYQFYFSTSSGKAQSGYVSKIKKYAINGLVLKPAADDESNYLGVIVNTGSATSYEGYTPVDVVNGSSMDSSMDLSNHIVLVTNSGAPVNGDTNGRTVKDNNGRSYLIDQNDLIAWTNDSYGFTTNKDDTNDTKNSVTIGEKTYYLDNKD